MYTHTSYESIKSIFCAQEGIRLLFTNDFQKAEDTFRDGSKRGLDTVWAVLRGVQGCVPRVLTQCKEGSFPKTPQKRKMFQTCSYDISLYIYIYAYTYYMQLYALYRDIDKQ